MATENPRSRRGSNLRQRAEERLAKRSRTPNLRIDVETSRLIHELQVHQVELEMQNEELIQTKAELEANYDELYNYAPVGYFTLGRNGDIEKVNVTGAAMLGQARASLIGQRLAQYVADESLPGFNAFLHRLHEGRDTQSCMVTLVRNLNTPVTTYIESTGAGAKASFRAVVVDITSAHQATQSLRQTEERMELLLAASGMGVWEWETESGSIYWSPNCAKIWGLSCICPTIETLAALLHPDDADRVKARIREALEEGKEQSERFRIKRPNGEIACVYARVQVKRDPQGNAQRLIGVLQDVSERDVRAVTKNRAVA
jgi:PAS domain S-box-containing protein